MNSISIKPLGAVISVANLDALVAWYRDMLSFRVTKERAFPEFGLRITFLEREGTMLELIENNQSVAGPSRSDPPNQTLIRGITQVALLVNDAEALYADLERRGVTLVWELRTYPDLGIKEFFARDPEGNHLLFIEKLSGVGDAA